MTKRYSEDHEWISVVGKEATIGISVYAQGQLGDVVFVEVPEIGRKLAKGEAAAVVESVKAASDVYSPASGTVSAVNPALAEDPAKVNADAEGEGWFYKITLSDPKELDGLMDEPAYKTYVEGLA